ncbi:MAG: 7-carboxy-7-deazaguanine synthase QueE [Methanomicrobia archaeon]|nr:7-carboxy-7-deazaguanine synthase QueE [Methanomicrobia archaeon]
MQKYFLSEIFFSVNGEGLQIGIPMVFIRLSGCNLRCKWCDTKDSWVQNDQVSLDDIVREVDKYDTEWVCITGGEPLLQDIKPLIKKLQYKISLETNGTIYDDIIKEIDFVSVDIKTPSSEMKNDFTVLQKVLDNTKYGQLKAVISDENDYLFVKNSLNEIDLKFPLILQPNFFELSYKDLFSLYSKNPVDHEIRILMQLHKIGDLK